MRSRIPFFALIVLSACAPEETELDDSVGDAPTSTAATPTALPAPPAQAGRMPYGWMLSGMAPADYEAVTDDQGVHRGRFSARLRARREEPSAFGTLMQSFDAKYFRGSRVRLRGFVRSSGVTGWSGLWMRVDVGGESASFDNMQNRPIVGDRPWHAVEIVLDVPERADEIFFGVLLDGPGTVWIDALELDKVDRSVPTTGLGSKDLDLPPAPVNLTFVESPPD